MALVEQLPLEIDQLSLLSEALNFDFATKDLDEPLTNAELASFSGLQTIRDRVVAVSGKANPTVREFMDFSHRGRPDDAIVGGPKEVADTLEEQFTERVCDGFVVAATHVPGGYADFVQYVVPELQRRGLFHTEYAGERCARTWACRGRRSARGRRRGSGRRERGVLGNVWLGLRGGGGGRFGGRAHRPRLGSAAAAIALQLKHERPDGDHRRQHRQQLGLAEAHGKRRVLAIELDEEAAQRVHAQIRPEQHAVARKARRPVESPAPLAPANNAAREPAPARRRSRRSITIS